MRILFVIARGDAFGGSSLHVRDLATRLREDGHQARILVGGDPAMEVPRRFAEKDLDFVCLNRLGRKINPLRDLGAMWDIRREIRRFSPDLVSTHASKGGALGRLAGLGLGTPVLYTPHCWSFVDGFPNAWAYRLLERGMAHLTTKIVTVCEDERQFGLSKGVGRAEQTVLIHNGVEDLAPGPAGANQPGPTPAPVRIAMVGRFEEQKDHGLLLSSLGELREFSWELTLVGEGPLKQRCVELARGLGITDRVDFAGYSAAVEGHLARSDLFALITNWEGFPRSILEAMRAGLPIITSDVGGCREAVIDYQTGRIVPRGDLKALTEALTELLSNPDLRGAMGHRSREIFLERFTFEEMYRQYGELYQSMLTDEAAGRTQSFPDGPLLPAEPHDPRPAFRDLG